MPWATGRRADKTRGRCGAEMRVWFRKKKKKDIKAMVSVHRVRYLLPFQDFRCVFSMMHASDLLTGSSKSAVNIYFT